MTAKSLALFLAAAISSAAGAQSWIRPYEAGLDDARVGKWAEAREAFQQASALRSEDQATATVLPGPATERKVWRKGAPYSPNFLAAYSLYREAIKATDAKETTDELKTAASEFETLVMKDQPSPEALFFLDVIYTRLDDVTKRQTILDRTAKLGKKADFKVDTEVVAPEEIAAIGARTAGAPVATNPNGAGGTIQGPGYSVSGGAPFGAGPVVSLNDAVGSVPNKFALVVGQSESRLSGGLVPFAATDADRVTYALENFAGYAKDNVQTLKNATATEIMAAANALASRMDENSLITIYFAGAGVNLGGKDYLAGKDTESASDLGTMLAKSALYDPFSKKGARIYAFFEANRPIDADKACFGREIPSIGSLSQMQATFPGSNVGETYRNNVPVGIFANAFVTALAEIHTNRIPIYDFGWQVVKKMRIGDTGLYGGGSSQVCTLPRFVRLAQDSKF